MKQIIEGLFVGDQNDTPKKGMYCVHAAKNPFHVDAVGYKGNLDKKHPNYLILQKPGNLYLNMIDPKFKLDAAFTNPIFEASIRFIAEAIMNDKEVLVRCNKGMSRSPSLVMTFMARAGMINNISFEIAKKQFIAEFYEDYEPGLGISLYLEENWIKLTN